MSDDLDEKDDSIKIVLLGEVATGKTSLINVYFGLSFETELQTTLTPSVSQKGLQINGNSYQIHIWDTAGQEKYRAMTKMFIKGTQIVIFVYDVTEEFTFTELDFWVKTVEEVLGKGPQLAVVGNKIDLVDKQVVDKEKGEEYANKIGAMFYETSAKEDSKGFQNFILQLTEEFINKKGYIKKSGEKLSKKEKKSKGCSC